MITLVSKSKLRSTDMNSLSADCTDIYNNLHPQILSSRTSQFATALDAWSTGGFTQFMYLRCVPNAQLLPTPPYCQMTMFTNSFRTWNTEPITGTCIANITLGENEYAHVLNHTLYATIRFNLYRSQPTWKLVRVYKITQDSVAGNTFEDISGLVADGPYTLANIPIEIKSTTKWIAFRVCSAINWDVYDADTYANIHFYDIVRFFTLNLRGI